MNSLLDMYGKPLLEGDPPTTTGKGKRPVVKLPRTGDIFGQWAGRDAFFQQLPGGAVMQFDLNKLTLADFRMMKTNYQISASLNVLSFVMHQVDWTIECDDEKIKDFITSQLRDNWTTLIRGIAQSFWAGYSPIAVNYENGSSGYVEISKFKDLVPEDCRPKWLKSDGWAPPGRAKPPIYTYDGLYHLGNWIPPENTFWYPLLMDNGDYFGRKLLKPAFPAWFFSNLIHLYTNRYFERFGEPLPVGRADFNQPVDIGNGEIISGKQAMETILTNVRNRAVVTLPNTRDPDSKEFDFSIDYLESQMRGADWERYLGRLDEEMALAVFTPSLLFRTSTVGSYNLGDLHYRIFQQELNALCGDMQIYFNKFLVDRLRVLNFGQDSPLAKWVYRKQGQGNIDQFKELMVELVRQGVAKPNYEELGAIIGLEFSEVEQLIADPSLGPDATGHPGSPATKGTPKVSNPNPDPNPTKTKATPKVSKNVLHEAASRVASSVGKGDLTVTLGFKNRFRDALEEDGYTPDQAHFVATGLYKKLNEFIGDAAPIAADGLEMKAWMQAVVDGELAEV